MTQKRGNPDQYLQKVGNTYYARIKVPRTLQRILKRTHLRRSLKTSSRAEANLRKHAVVSEIKAQLAECRKNPPAEDAPFTFAEAKAFRAHLEQVRLHGEDHEVETLEIAASDFAERMERLHGTERASRWYRVATASGENLSIARFVGHKVGPLAADTYSDGGTKALALEVAAKVRYSTAVEKAAMALANR